MHTGKRLAQNHLKMCKTGNPVDSNEICPKIQTVSTSGFLPEIRVALSLTCYPEIPRLGRILGLPEPQVLRPGCRQCHWQQWWREQKCHQLITFLMMVQTQSKWSVIPSPLSRSNSLQHQPCLRCSLGTPGLTKNLPIHRKRATLCGGRRWRYQKNIYIYLILVHLTWSDSSFERKVTLRGTWNYVFFLA